MKNLEWDPSIWDAIIERFKYGKVTPILSQRILEKLLPGSDSQLQFWAEEVNYPFNYRPNRFRIAQYCRIQLGAVLAARLNYLRFAKKHLIDELERLQQLKEPNIDYSKLSFGNIVEKLGILRNLESEENPLQILANFKLPIYLTTSYDDLLERTLSQNGQEPITETSNWNLAVPTAPNYLQMDIVRLSKMITQSFNTSELKTLTLELNIQYEEIAGSTLGEKAQELVSKFVRLNDLPILTNALKEKRPNVDWKTIWGNAIRYPPTTEQPLVYHLFGIDEHPESMVLTEDDYFDFLVQVSRERGLLADEVHTAITENTLLLLGYDIEDWEFKLLFQGIILKKERHRGRLNVSIQIDPKTADTNFIKSPEKAQEYLQEFFKESFDFRVYWGDSLSFLKEISQRIRNNHNENG